ncbi:hypothetical protein LEP1GSC112_4032, partial [Leptospira interrogans serovar Pomona str. UT364]
MRKTSNICLCHSKAVSLLHFSCFQIEIEDMYFWKSLREQDNKVHKHIRHNLKT